jgi:hypothetical protein
MSEPRYPPEVIERAETLVSRIQGVSSCRISTDELGTITEIHVVATCQKPAKLIARDVESCLMAVLGMNIDHRKIGVVFIDAPKAEPVPPDVQVHTSDEQEAVEFPVEEFASRFEFQSVNLFISHESIQAEVELVRDKLEVLGNAETANINLSPLRVVAEATLKAVGQLFDDTTRFCLADVEEVVVGKGPAVMVKVDLMRSRDVKSLVGCSLFSGNINQTVVFATLDAVNRVLGKLASRKSLEYRIK